MINAGQVQAGLRGPGNLILAPVADANMVPIELHARDRNIDLGAVLSRIENRRKFAQRFQPTDVLRVRIDPEVDPDILKSAANLIGQSEETAQIEIALDTGFERSDLDSTYRCVIEKGPVGSLFVDTPGGSDSSGRSAKPELSVSGNFC